MNYRYTLKVTDFLVFKSNTVSPENVFVQNAILKTTTSLLSIMRDFNASGDREFTVGVGDYLTVTYTWTTSPDMDLVVVIHDPC